MTMRIQRKKQTSTQKKARTNRLTVINSCVILFSVPTAANGYRELARYRVLQHYTLINAIRSIANCFPVWGYNAIDPFEDTANHKSLLAYSSQSQLQCHRSV